MNLELNCGVLLTMISINMTIIGLTSLAERKTIIGVDYGNFLIKKYKLFRIFPIYVLLLLFAVINTLALLALYLTDYNLRATIFVSLTICLSFAIYYFFGFILKENRYVKSQLYENEFIGLYYKDDTSPKAECDIIVKMNNGYRTSKCISTDVVAYFNKFNNDTLKAFEDSFGPHSFIYKRNKRIIKQYIALTGHEPYDYRGVDDLVHISWEFFQLYRWSDLQEKWIIEILVLFNDKYAVNSPEMRLNNIIRVLFHINVFGRTENMFGYRVIEYLYKYVKDSYLCFCKPSTERTEKEKTLLSYYCQYLFTCVNAHYSEQSYNLVIRILKDLIACAGINGHINKHDMIRIILTQSAQYNDINIEQIATILYNVYFNITSDDEQKISLPIAKAIIIKKRQEQPNLIVSRCDLFPLN
ncbi:MAG: hypothetical protein J6K38_08295 [Alistipes sp.]|nr:hypothetical protein [Alistipes sp.]